MCSLDALAIAPVFCTRTTIASTCAISGRPITIDQDGDLVVAIDPATPWVGIHWQRPCRPAAHTLCREMVFLFDEQTAREWQGGDVDGRFVCSVPAGIDLAERFFGPLT
jgi:mercuric reductase